MSLASTQMQRVRTTYFAARGSQPEGSARQAAVRVLEDGNAHEKTYRYVKNAKA